MMKLKTLLLILSFLLLTAPEVTIAGERSADFMIDRLIEVDGDLIIVPEPSHKIPAEIRCNGRNYRIYSYDTHGKDREEIAIKALLFNKSISVSAIRCNDGFIHIDGISIKR